MRKKEKDMLLETNKTPLKKYLGKYWHLYLMMLEPLIYFVVFKYAPMFGNVLAFRRYRPGRGAWGTDWVGFLYFERFFKDPAFWSAFKNTLVLALLNLVINFPIPIIFAVLLNEINAVGYKKAIQTISYMPRFVSTVVVIAIIGELLSPSSGIVNKFIKEILGMEPIYFMNDPKYFRVIYILLDTWQFTGWTAIIYLAAITSIPQDMYEAAVIDGAGHFQQIWYVTIPSIMPTIMIMLIMNVGRLLSLGYEKVLLMYTPANSGVSDILDTLIYRTGLANQNYSYVTAIGLFTGIIGVILVSSSNYLSKRLTGESIY